MDRRNWPWRRKASDRSMSEAGEIPASQIEAGATHDAAPNGSPADDSRSLNGATNGFTLFSDDYHGSVNVANDGFSLLSDDYNHSLNNGFTFSSSADFSVNDDAAHHRDKLLTAAEDMVKQHAKLAEEAVSGWEKARSECSSVKQQLERVSEQKRTCEAMVSRLEACLRDSMAELRRLQGQQEDMVLQAVVKTRAEMAAEAAGQKKKSAAAMATAAEREAVQKQKAAAMVAAMEKENSAVKQEAMAMKQERDMYRRSAEAATKQHLDDIRKISKLEAECRRLRASASGKMDGVESPRSVHSESFASDRLQLLSDRRLLAMEEETRRLKASLVMANKEIQHLQSTSVRRTPSPSRNGRGGDEAVEDDDEDNHSVAESWASVLISDLAQLQKEKSGMAVEMLQTKQQRRRRSPAKALDCRESTDDFIEMERLAMASVEQEEAVSEAVGQTTVENGKTNRAEGTGKKAAVAEEALATAVRKLVRLLCGKVSHGSEISTAEKCESVVERYLKGEMGLEEFMTEVVSCEGAPTTTTTNGGPLPAVPCSEEMRRVRAEKAAMESHMRAEFGRIAGVEQALEDAIREKTEAQTALRRLTAALAAAEDTSAGLHAKLATAGDISAGLRAKLATAEDMATGLRTRLAAEIDLAADLRAQLAVEADLAVGLRAELATEAGLAVGLRAELVAVEETVASLRAELAARQVEMEERNRVLQVELEEMRGRIAPPSCSEEAAAEVAGETAASVGSDDKEQQIITDATLKLGECHQTILTLQHQLQELAMPTARDATGGSNDTVSVATGGTGDLDNKPAVATGETGSAEEGKSGGNVPNGREKAVETSAKVSKAQLQLQQQSKKKNFLLMSASQLSQSWNLPPPSSSATSSPSKRRNGISRLLSWQKKAP